MDGNDDTPLTAADEIPWEPEPEPEPEEQYSYEPEVIEIYSTFLVLNSFLRFPFLISLSNSFCTQPETNSSSSAPPSAIQAARDAYESAARGGLASRFDRPLAKRVVPIVPESHVGSQVLKIEGKTKGARRFI